MIESLGTIKLFAGDFAPLGYLSCQGQCLHISEYEELFQLIGTTYGGDGQETFALPDLRGRVPLGTGQGTGLTERLLADMNGTEQVMLTTPHLPAHEHSLRATTQPGNSGVPSDAFLAATDGAAASATGVPRYKKKPTADTMMKAGSMTETGGSQPHSNMQPYLGLNYIICVEGAFPFPS